jgi:acetoin utilization deacetylase AcuC-like enzyme
MSGLPVGQTDLAMLIVASDAHRAHESIQIDDGVIGPSAESPDRVDIIRAALRDAGHVEISADDHDDRLLRRVHTPEYVDFLASAWTRWVDAGKDAPAAMGFVWPTRSFRAAPPTDIVGLLGYHSFTADTAIVEGTYPAARAAASIAVTAADRAMATGIAVYALCRPPGHHATPDQFGGYCFFNNAALAAQRCRDAGAARVAILDIDYHHGNGTEVIHLERADVVVTSIHADPAVEFPWFAGFADERGRGDGVGANLNLPLPMGASTIQWFGALDQALEFVSGASVDALVVSLGLDTYIDDPLGTFSLTTDDYGRVAQSIRSLKLPTVIVQEGGYAVEDLGRNVAAFLAPWDSDDSAMP